MKVLFIGGTGIISSAVSQLAIDQGIDLYLLNRGQSSRPVPDGATVIHGDINNDPDGVAQALADHHFDAVVDWIAFVPEQIQRDIELFRGKTGQFIFISSASAYQKPIAHLPITESTPLHNPYWEYSRNKTACEEMLMAAYRSEGFPITIVRPSHTYDKTLLPTRGGWTAVDRMRRGLPVVVHGDGTSLWVMTHHRDFAVGFVGLLANPKAIGHAFHITSDEVLTWDQITRITAEAAGVTDPQIVHVPSETIASHHPDIGAGLLGDKAHSVIFDNSKIRRLVPAFNPTIPFSEGIKEVIAYYDADPARQKVEPEINELFDTLIAAQRGAMA